MDRDRKRDRNGIKRDRKRNKNGIGIEKGIKTDRDRSGIKSERDRKMNKREMGFPSLSFYGSEFFIPNPPLSPLVYPFYPYIPIGSLHLTSSHALTI
jgi:hypothetical protein